MIGLTIAFITLPSINDILYFRGLFQLIRVLHDYTLGWLPIPTIYIAVFILLSSFVYLFSKAKNGIGYFKAIAYPFLVVITCFYFLWGFNYFKPSFTSLSKIEIQDISEEQLLTSFLQQTQILNELRDSTIHAKNTSELESIVRPLLEQQLAQWDIPTYGRVRVRKLFGGSLLHLRTSGIYIPHAMEGHIDGGLYDLQWPFTLAHEMSHGYGLTDESVCNFVAYVVCSESSDPLLRYSAALAYWRYLARNCGRENYLSELEKLTPLVRSDLAEIRSHIEKYKELLAQHREKIYDQYLKTHQVSAGIKSYDQMVLLVESWKMDGTKN